MPSDARLRQVFVRLAGFPEIGSALCRAAAQGAFQHETSLRTICARLGVSQGQAYRVQAVLDAGVSAGAFVKVSPLSWAAIADLDYSTLALWLEGAALYLADVHSPKDDVSVVLTKPPSPSRLETLLGELGHRAVLLENTGEVFSNIASGAQERLLVMTPFVDALGAQTLLELFKAAPPTVAKQLVFRGQDGKAPLGLLEIWPALQALGVEAFNYWLPKERKGFYETFHAKVVLADSSRCYVGSANMTNASFAYSVELGFLVEGASARTVGWVCDAIREVSSRFD